jgi:hypothetical protein
MLTALPGHPASCPAGLRHGYRPWLLPRGFVLRGQWALKRVASASLARLTVPEAAVLRTVEAAMLIRPRVLHLTAYSDG